MEQFESSDPPRDLVLTPAPVGLRLWPPWASVAGKHSLGMRAPLAVQTQCLFVEDTFFFRAASIS